MTQIFIDIETLPDLRPGAREKFIEAARENVKVPTGATKETLAADLGITDKDEIKLTARTTLDARWIAEVGPSQAEPAGDAEWRKTSFSGLSGQLLMIGIAIDDETPFVLEGEESLILDDFRRALGDIQKRDNMGLPTFVGHNLIDFDLPFIFHRSVMLGVAPHITFPVAPSRYSERIYDTMTKWAGFNGRVKLDLLARALEVGTKGDIDGSMVYDYYAAGRVNELIEYCKNDVAMTREVYRRMTFQDQRLAA